MNTERRLSIFGVGPVFVGLSLVYTAVGLSLRVVWPEAMAIACIPASILRIAGATLVVAGLALFITAVRTLAKGSPDRKLFTRGAYAVCRHPIYGAWVSLIVPGLGLFMRSWPVLGVVVAMHATLRLLVVKEERELERLFGDEFRAYKKATPAVFPMLHRICR